MTKPAPLLVLRQPSPILVAATRAPVPFPVYFQSIRTRGPRVFVRWTYNIAKAKPLTRAAWARLRERHPAELKGRLVRAPK